jgi:signal transduction histidine kinase
MTKQPLYPMLTKLYTTGITLCGVGLIIVALQTPFAFPSQTTPLLLFTLLVITFLIQIITIFSKVFEDTGVSVTSAISLAAAATFGVMVVPLVAAFASLGFIYKRYQYDPIPLKKGLELFGFNLGMWSIAGVMGGLLYQLVVSNFDSLAGVTFGWIVASLVTNQVNVILLVGVIAAHDSAKSPIRTIYSQHIWAIQQDIILSSIGGAMLWLALRNMGLLGIAVIALPLVLSSLSFRAYVKKTQEQMEQLEGMVADRTAELQTAYDDLAQLNVQKGQFLAVLSHDMKTPLSAIRLYAQMMQRSPDIAPERRMHMLETILQSEKALTDMVMDIVEIERMQLGHRPTLTYGHYDFSRMLNEICLALSPLAEKKSLMLTVIPTSTPVLMYGDEARLRRVFENLLSNAVKYTPEGGRVHLWTTHDEEQIKVYVMDTGYGIPEDNLEAIFAPYHRVKENEQYAVGTGLGLAIVKGFIDMHGGSIEVSSEVGSGSQFEVTLPLHGPPPIRKERLTVESADPDAIARPLPPNSRPSSPRPRQSV